MRSVSSTSLKTLFALSALILLSACGSELTGIDAPESVEPGQTFDVSVTHRFLEDDLNPADSPDGAFVFGVIVTPGLTVGSVANYQGTWDGVPVDLDLELQSGIPDTNLVEYLESDEAPEEVIEYASISDCSTVLDELSEELEGNPVQFFQTTTDLSEGPSPVSGDTGEFTVQLTAGQSGGDGAVVVIHGLLIGGPIEPEGDVLGCSWFPDGDLVEPGEPFIPDNEIAEFIQFASDSTARPVPALGGAMIAILALLLAIAGILVGRRRPGQRD